MSEWSASGRVGLGPAPSSDHLLLGLLWKSHRCVFLVGDSLHQRAEPQAISRAALQGATGARPAERASGRRI